MWQYANMAIFQIGYIRRVANENTALNRIRELREVIGLSQAELARRAHVEPSTINKLELGRRGLDQDWMRRLAPILGVTPAELLPIEDNPMLLDDQERDLVVRYRAAEDRDRAQFNRVADAMLPYAERNSDAA